MQVLWSRAVQVRSSCRCSSCLHAATTLARSTTTAATRRRLKVSDVFTACYSTILATAALADARVKEDRSKAWDQLIEEAKKPSKKVRDIQSGQESETDSWEVQKPREFTADVTEYPFTTYKTVQDTNYNSPERNGLHSWQPPLPLPEVGTKLSHLDWKLRNSTAARIALRDVDSRYEAGLDAEGQWQEELYDPDSWSREPKTDLHLHENENMIRDMVSAILHQSEVFSKTAAYEDMTPCAREELSNMAKSFVALNTSCSSFPSYTYDDIGFVDQERKNLHRSLWAMSYATSRGQAHPNVTIAKMCYNMLVSPVPPNISTYNLLLDQFKNLGRLDLAQVVVDSFLDDSRLRPNKTTIRLLLDHYRAKSDPAGFRDMVKRMNGTQDGLRIRKRHISQLDIEIIANWDSNNKTIHRGGFIKQKAPRARPIYNSLIPGSLEFRDTRAAVRHVRSALREGYEISINTLCEVIASVVKKLDAYAGASLLRAIASQWEDGSLVSLTTYTKQLRYHINQLLLLCGIDVDSTGSSNYLSSLVSPAVLQAVLRPMKLGTLTDAVESSASFVLRLDAALGLSGLDLTYAGIDPASKNQECPSQRLDWALRVIRKQNKAEQRRIARKLNWKQEGRLLRLQVIGNMLDDGWELIHTRQSEVLEWQITAKKLDLEAIIRNTVPVDQETAEMYVRALIIHTSQPPLFDDHPMFQAGNSTSFSLDPLSRLEWNLFNANSKQLFWHRNRISKLHASDSLDVRKRLTLLRVEHIKTLLIKYTDPERGQCLKAERRAKKNTGIPFIAIDHVMAETLERYIHSTFGPTNDKRTQEVEESISISLSPVVVETVAPPPSSDDHLLGRTRSAGPYRSTQIKDWSQSLPQHLTLPQPQFLREELEAAA